MAVGLAGEEDEVGGVAAAESSSAAFSGAGAAVGACWVPVLGAWEETPTTMAKKARPRRRRTGWRAIKYSVRWLKRERESMGVCFGVLMSILK